MLNFINMTDGYKLDHRRQYPPGTQRVYSNFTPRTSRVVGQTHVNFLGLQYFLQEYMVEHAQRTFFEAPKYRVLGDYKRLLDRYLPGNDIEVDHIADLHDIGYVPLQFNAVPEGTRVPLGIPMFTIENTIDEFFWVTNYFETLISSVIWQMCTSASTAYRYREILLNYSDPAFIPWQAHDFSFRGMSGPEAAARSGAGHLVYFDGTDCLPAMELVEKHYDGLVGGSVPATEHSVMCAGGADDELGTYDRIISLYPKGLVSLVSDTWDLWNVITNILPQLKSKIMARDGKVVIRPDSGDPILIICGDPNAPQGTPQRKGVVHLLWDVFGGTLDRNGRRVLDQHIGAIYGDSITETRCDEICKRLILNGFSPMNVVFGIGSYTYQLVTRDTHGFAIKATWTKRNGVGHVMQKDPITDTGGKKSARGRLGVSLKRDGYKLYESDTIEGIDAMPVNMLKPVWEDGIFLRRTDWTSVRMRAEVRDGEE